MAEEYYSMVKAQSFACTINSTSIAL